MGIQHCGMTSVTFREKTVSEVIAIAKKAGLSCIEWGADRHILPDDRETAREAVHSMAACGITCPSYGTYYRVGDADDALFSRLCETATILGASTVRTWLGRKGSRDVTPDEREGYLLEVRRMAKIAEEYGLCVAFEFHGKTLNDNGASSVAFLRDCGMTNVKTYWQPLAFGNSIENLRAVLPYLASVHVFHWDREYNRYPLSDGMTEWRQYAALLREARCDVPCLLEFTAGDDDGQFLSDAHTLKELFA